MAPRGKWDREKAHHTSCSLGRGEEREPWPKWHIFCVLGNTRGLSYYRETQHPPPFPLSLSLSRPTPLPVYPIVFPLSPQRNTQGPGVDLRESFVSVGLKSSAEPPKIPKVYTRIADSPLRSPGKKSELSERPQLLVGELPWLPYRCRVEHTAERSRL